MFVEWEEIVLSQKKRMMKWLYLLHGVVVQVPGQPAHVALRSLLVLKSELHGVEILALLEDPVLGATLPQHGEVLEHKLHDIVAVLDPLLGQVNVHHEESEPLAATLLAAHQGIDPAAGLETKSNLT